MQCKLWLLYAEELKEQQGKVDIEYKQMQEELDGLRTQNASAQREFNFIMEQTQLDLDDEEATSKLQIDRLMREHVEHLHAQLHVYTRCVLRLHELSCWYWIDYKPQCQFAAEHT
jgi:hypothetical protein